MKQTLTAHVYRPRRRKAGKLIQSRLYRARIRFPGERKVRDLSLGVTELRSAEQKLNQLLTEHSQESVGQIPPRKMRNAAEIPLTTHLAGYVRELTTRGRVPRYVQSVETCFGALMKDCKWEFLKDVSAESFSTWRQSQTKAPKTLNEYFVTARAFLKWVVRLGYLTQSPLVNVEPVRVQGRQKRTRRAYTPDEVQKLLGVAGDRRTVYLATVLTGLRRGELKQLRWCDLSLDSKPPVVTVRASISKKPPASEVAPAR